ncbi:MAG TPA: GntR family transcriptional regulator, partial [Halanaerobiales bacterium]|nr:GntR family transcriptional regulator [Halanaerobiales bacterium]
MDNCSNRLSKYIIIKNYYLEYIEKNELKEGALLPSELEVSRKFKYSRDTVRRALNELENEGYVRRERGKGTFYTRPVRKFGERKIAVLTTFVSNYIFPSIISGIEGVVSSRNYMLTLASSNNDPALEKIHLQKIIDSQVDGLIIEPTRSSINKQNRDLYRELYKRGIPFVMINAYYRDLKPAFVVIDDFKGEYIATKYLLQLGHRQIAGIFKRDDLQGLYRKQGYLKALKEYGVSIDKKIIGEYNTNEMATYSYYFTDKLIKEKVI